MAHADARGPVSRCRTASSSPLCRLAPTTSGRGARFRSCGRTCSCPRALWLRQATSLRPPDLDVRLEGGGLVLSAVKPAAAGGLVLRCYNAGTEPVEGSWRLGRAAAHAELVRADERGARTLALADGGRSIPFRAGPRAS